MRDALARVPRMICRVWARWQGAKRRRMRRMGIHLTAMLEGLGTPLRAWDTRITVGNPKLWSTVDGKQD